MVCAVDLGAFFDDADDGAGEVEVTGLIDAGHVGGFAAEEGESAIAAGVGDATDDVDFLVFGEAVVGEVVEEEEGLGAGGENVVDAVVDEVLADAVEALQGAGDEHLAADAVGGGDEDGVGEGAEVKEAAKRSDAADDFWPMGLVRRGRDSGG